ncbi:unnamed protein product [Lactuca virosa]|uniref:Uncharacterized protein n=1 Tax=Lactuca virosa TaxID=75947 RepID=A0AAU9LFZ2_9ASTR|nr:unnamed protein product [Lactuca virosa]
MEKQSEQLRDISSRYEHDKKVWVAAVKELSHRITVLKPDHSQLSLQAHHCANSVPDLNNMVSVVQALGGEHTGVLQMTSTKQTRNFDRMVNHG